MEVENDNFQLDKNILAIVIFYDIRSLDPIIFSKFE